MDKNTIFKRAVLAADLKKNKLFDEMFTDVKNHFIQKWESTNLTEIEGREMYYKCVKCVDMLRSQIDGYINEALIEKQK